MTDQEFQKQVLEAIHALTGEVNGLTGEVNGLKGDVNKLTGEFHEFRDEQRTNNLNQEEFNGAIWTLNNQASSAINEIRSEVLPPWKVRKSNASIV